MFKQGGCYTDSDGFEFKVQRILEDDVAQVIYEDGSFGWLTSEDFNDCEEV